MSRFQPKRLYPWQSFFIKRLSKLEEYYILVKLVNQAAPYYQVSTFRGFDQLLTYSGLKGSSEVLSKGMLVKVPLGTREALGIIIGVTDRLPEGIAAGRIKGVRELVYPQPVLSEDLITLALWVKKYYTGSWETIWQTFIPADVRSGGMAPKSVIYYQFKCKHEGGVPSQTRAPQQYKLYEFLKSRAMEAFTNKELESLTQCKASALKALVDKGYVNKQVEESTREAYRDEHANVVASLPKLLTEEQQAATGDIIKSLESEQFVTHLLQGVTGSGKTEVYLQAIEHTIKAGRQALILVPEVALTPQTADRLRSRLANLGIQTAVWHSQLSAGERFDAWKGALEGSVQVVIGARSAIFAPLPKLKLIVVDEEHESSYKQSETPRYHGRDLAVYRASITDSVCILGSATPSLESLQNAKHGKYKLNLLKQRVDDRQLPRIILVNMAHELRRKTPYPYISNILTQKLYDRFEKKEQTILFLNRRGYSPALVCGECEYVAQCDSCSVRLTYHRTSHQLRCHFCGYQCSPPKKCPSCSAAVHMTGQGTQKVEEAIKAMLPQARVARIDADTMTKKHRFREIFNDFRSGKLDILIGTQMIAKGLDFPRVTLVGLIDADVTLHLPDFRANERAFQLLVQVAGRAGRGDLAGEVVVQTLSPQSEAIQYARHNDFDGFLDHELAIRQSANYPPFRRLIRHLFRSESLSELEQTTDRWVQVLEQQLPLDTELRGPAPAPIERIKNEYRFHLWILTPHVGSVLPIIEHQRGQFKWPKGVTQVVDVDPYELT